jgi:diguanylate cyclase (GGDEF)-like protein/PAS domain S-box-containing protein
MGCESEHMGTAAPHTPEAASTQQLLQEAQTQLQRFALVCDSVPMLMAYYLCDSFVCAWANQGYASHFGYTTQTIAGQALADILGEDTLKLIQPHIDRLLDENREVTYHRTTTHGASGQRQWFEVRLVPHHANGMSAPMTGALVQITDLTRFHVAERALRESEERLRKFMGASVEGIAFHRDGLITDVNQPMASLLGYQPQDLLGKAVLDFIWHDQRDRVIQGMAHLSELPYESALIDRQGQRVPVELIARQIHDEGQALRMVVVRDIRDRQAVRERMRYLARHDALTGLHNRGAFMESLTKALARQRTGQHAMALLFIDLDHFKHINDSLGHLAGDALLRIQAERLMARLQPNAVAGRFGGDEFVLLLPEVASREEARQAAWQLQHAMAEPVIWNGQPMMTTPTIGVAISPADGDSADTFLRHADMAMYAGKAAGRATVTLFEPSMAAAVEAAQYLEAALSQGLAQGEFELSLHPRLNLRSGRLAGLQARLRWRHPTRGVLTPDSFVGSNSPLAMQPLLEWSLQEATRLVTQWQSMGLKVPLSLQLSPLVSKGHGLPLALDRTVTNQSPQGSAGLLNLELPEQMAGEARLLAELNRRQVGVSLDGFGTGGAALSSLRHLGLTGCVLDPDLVAGVAIDQRAQAVVQAIVQLADGLGLQACATAVETGAQAEALRTLGCHQLQGPWYGPPAMTASEASAWLASGNA